LNKISCDYNFPTFPASSPYVLGVGGTQWSGAPSPSQPIGEQVLLVSRMSLTSCKAWNSGGCGFSWQFPTPSYQSAVVRAYLAANSNAANFPPPGSFNPNGRAYPDVSALADNIPMVEQGQDQG
jgi:tripeptidyl-peptidase-1